MDTQNQVSVLPNEASRCDCTHYTHTVSNYKYQISDKWNVKPFERYHLNTQLCCLTCTEHKKSKTEHKTHTHPFNGSFSGTTQVSRYQKGKTNLDFTEARDSEWQWHQLGNMQVCTLLQTGNHASTPPDALPAAQPTAWKQWRQDRT